MVRRDNGQGCLFRRGRRWAIQYYSAGRRIIEATGLTDRVQAQDVLTQRLAKVARGEPVTVRKLRVQQLYDFKLKHAKGRLLKDMPVRWKPLQRHFGNLIASRVTPEVIMAYRAQRAAQGKAVGTINRETDMLRAIFRLAHKNGLISWVPYFYHEKERNVRKGFVPDNKVDQLKQAAAKVGLWMRTFVELGCSYGWRLSEMLGLTVQQCDFVERLVRLEVGETKSGEGREVPMTPAVQALLQQLCHGKRPADKVFTRDDGSEVKYPRVAWSKLCIGVGLGTWHCLGCGHEQTERGRCPQCNVYRWSYRGLHVHDLRRTAARRLIRAGVPEPVAMKILGHETNSCFRRYNIVTNTDKVAALVLLGKAEQQWAASNGPKASRRASEAKPDGYKMTTNTTKQGTQTKPVQVQNVQ